MKYLRQFSIILTVSFLGEVLNHLLPLPVPGSVYGLVLMLLALCTGLVKLEQVKGAADFLIEIMPVLFIPSTVGIMASWGLLQPILIPAAVIVVGSTLIVMAVTGLTAQGIIRRGGKGKEGKTDD